MELTGENELIGKTISFSSDESVMAMTVTGYCTFFGKKFVCGLIPAGSTINDWAKGASCSLRCDLITDFIIFHSEQEYCDSMKKNEESNF